jgi:Uma2 family endonuclease
MLNLRKTFISAEEYFAIEEAAGYKSEYYHGEMFAMSGASFHHNVIAMNVAGTLYSALRNSDCMVFGSDMKVELDKARHYAYPDISAVCGDVRFAAGRNDTIVNPVLIIEVLSESTHEYDRGLKFKAYQNIPSLKEYILIDQYSCRVEYFFKGESGRWNSEKFDKPEDTVKIYSVDAELSLKEIYHRIKFKK